MPWRTNVAVIICQCVYSTCVKTDWKNIAWLKNGRSLKSFYYIWTTRYMMRWLVKCWKWRIWASWTCKGVISVPKCWTSGGAGPSLPEAPWRVLALDSLKQFHVISVGIPNPTIQGVRYKFDTFFRVIQGDWYKNKPTLWALYTVHWYERHMVWMQMFGHFVFTTL